MRNCKPPMHGIWIMAENRKTQLMMLLLYNRRAG